MRPIESGTDCGGNDWDYLKWVPLYANREVRSEHGLHSSRSLICI